MSREFKIFLLVIYIALTVGFIGCTVYSGFRGPKYVVVLCGLDEQHYALICDGYHREVVPIKMAVETTK